MDSCEGASTESSVSPEASDSALSSPPASPSSLQAPVVNVRPCSPNVECLNDSVVDSPTRSANRLRRQRQMARSASLTVADYTSRWKEVFGMFDQNLDGIVTTAELGSKMRSLGCNATQGEVEDLLHEWDKDDKGALTLTEFTLMMNSHKLGRTNSETERRMELKAAFDLFDRDKNGVLDAGEVETALRLLGEESSEEAVAFVMREADGDKDGVINFKEFCSVVGGLGLSPQSPFFFHGKSALRRQREQRTVRREYQLDEASARTV